MRQRLALVLVALAAFLAVLGVMLRVWVYPHVVAVPDNQYQAVVLEAKDATLIDYSRMAGVPHQHVTIVETLKGDAQAAQAEKRRTGRDVVVWDALSYVLGNDGKMLSAIPEIYPFDARTQEPVHCCGENVDGQALGRVGIEYKFPFDTQPHDYQYFDPQTRASAPIHYKGTTTLDGLTVYYFEQTIPWTRVPFPKAMPEGVAITPAQIDKLGYQRWYTTVRKFWVDPVTGAPVNGEELHNEQLRMPPSSGLAPVTIFSGDVRIRPDYEAATVALVKKERTLLLLLHDDLPVGMELAAVAALALAFVVEGRARRNRATASVPDADEDRGAGDVAAAQGAPAAPL
ncbi:DUF3068 domain-containing protein [Streptacidiphilus jiangxiensis]|uniref:DUF3068 domain-containing protein n=1 Tax=Streptacidiphilus jiangxiensis TaxID=235985 RepID=A0A1H7SHC4_STRJI|nr:DUF3068 domain-containing protein [Streptacidiphilus jiangxiensis]SEL72091.1 Protein of unknown function [Streptacidiphilus jiangxiensis]